MMTMSSAFVIVVFNTDKFLEKQINLIEKYYNQSDILVIDNSLDLNYSAKIRMICKHYDIEYTKTVIKEGDPSISHADACNVAYTFYQDEYDILIYMDHDCFPVDFWDIVEFMQDRPLAGVVHVKERYRYFWAGFTIINNTLVDKDKVDFSPIGYKGVRLDTGGAMHHLITDDCGFISQRQVTKEMGVDFYNFYEDIGEGKFIHFINGCNWNNEHPEQYENRINELLKLLP